MFYIAQADLEQRITGLGLRTVLWASLIMVVLTIAASLLKKNKVAKLPLFIMMATTLVGTTVLLFGSTIYLNVKSESGGPVHWHTDIEFWACGTELELRDPHGLLSNKIGTATYHEHNDKRIHLEGVVVRKNEDASLRKFMDVIGGYIGHDRIGIPLNDNSQQWFAVGNKVDGDKQSNDNTEQLKNSVHPSQKGPVLELVNGQRCGSEPAELQAFVYTFDKKTKTYTQRKADNPAEYVMRDESVVPPGDCVIVEFEPYKDRTDRLCRQYGVRDAKRCVEFGVKEYNPELCNIRDPYVTEGGQ